MFDNREAKIYGSQAEGKRKELSDEDLKMYSKPVDVKQLNERKNQLVALQVQFDGVKKRYDERQTEYDGMPEAEKQLEEKFVKIETGLSTEEEELRAEFERKLQAIKTKRQENAKMAEDELTALKARKNIIVEQNKKANTYINEAEIELKEVPTLDQKIDNADTHNKKHTKVVEYRELKKKLDEVLVKAKNHETKLDALSNEREKLISSSKLPVPGLNFGDDGLILNGIPFMPGKVSSSQEMEVIARLIIAKNQEAKVFLMSRGESLGSKKLKALADFAKENGFQGFIEQVSRGQKELRVEEYIEK